MARNIERLTMVLNNLNKPVIKQNQEVWASLEEIPDAHYNGWGQVPGAIVDAYEGKELVSCASAGCIAGTACMQAGDLISIKNLTLIGGRRNSGYMVMNVHPVDNYGATVSVGTRGAELLGLTENEANALFEADNRIEQLKVALQMLIDGDSEYDVCAYLADYNDMVTHPDHWDCDDCDDDY